MKERPILFSAPMVRALLAGTKTQTRRVVKPQPPEDRMHTSVDTPDKFVCPGEHTWWAGNHTQGIYHSARCPYGQPGDRLWVREAWARTPVYQALGQDMVVYREGDNRTDYGGPWKPRIHMFRADSRILLEVTDVRVERLQSISEADAASEGLIYNTDYMGHWSGTGECWYSTAREAFRDLWKSINGAGSWDANPFVWAVSFRVIKGGQP